jgi:proline racemase/trans-L-3-hydroxyproline dehydratase
MVKRTIVTVESHTAGEPTRIIIGGIPHVPGRSMMEKKEYFRKNLDFLRTALMQEPRGHRDMFGALVVAPCDDEADLGVVFIDSDGYADMCGHGSLGLMTVAVETGMVEAVEPITKVNLDTPAGLVRGEVAVRNGAVESATLHNVPSFLYKSISLRLPEIGEVPVDIAFGGNFYALVSAEHIRVEINISNSAELIRAGVMIKEAANREIKIEHPEKPEINQVFGTRIYDGKPPHPEAQVRNFMVLGDGYVDRSPCGTGTSAHIAMLHAKGQLKLNELSVHESIIGTTFSARALEEVMVGDFQAIVPEISGRAFITGMCTWTIDPTDPIKHGFLLRG